MKRYRVIGNIEEIADGALGGVILFSDHTAAIRREADAGYRYRDAILIVCEGWTLPNDVRKILETALWSDTK